MSMSFLIIPAFLTIAALSFFRRRGKREAPREMELSWGEMNLFERHGNDGGVGRIEATLHMGCEKLGLPNSLVTLRQGDHCHVQNVASLDGSGDPFVPGQVVPADLFFCGMLGESRGSIAIDYAGISEWRRHRAHAELGWQSYIGVRRELSNGENLVIAFYHHRSRETLFTAAEKNLVGQLGNWVAAILERERLGLVGPMVARTEITARA